MQGVSFSLRSRGYVLHQTVILTIGYPVVRWAIPDAAKWAIIAVCSLVATVGLCGLVRRSAVLRVLFGMQPVLR